jgi:hypothetical protein
MLTMIIELVEQPDRFEARLAGEVRWNDRLGVSRLARALRASLARVVVVDTRASVEVDSGSLRGVLATFERMALVEGKRLSVVTA